MLSHLLVQTNQTEAIKSQQDMVKLWRQSPNGFEVGVRVLERQVSENPHDLLLAKLLKDIYLRELHTPDKAVALYEKLVSNNPDNISLKQELISLYQATKRYEAVAALYKKQIGTGSGNDEWLQYQVASHLLYAGKEAEAFQYAKESLGGSSASPENLERISRLHETANQWTEASETLTQAIRTSTNTQQSANMSIHLGELYIRSQKYDEALAHLQKLRVSPELSAQQKAIVNEQIFRIYKKQGRLAELTIEAAK
ncbi:MAG: hypothetical protein WC701_08270 [Kiritimatiellales bacterium]